jgi:diacylglycerol kinase family enzyme
VKVTEVNEWKSGSASREVVILANPRAGRGRGAQAVEQLQRELESRQFEPVVATNPDELTERVAAASTAGSLRAVVLVGGDGTVQLAANRLPLHTPMTILPMGTENLLARYFGMSSNPAHVAEAVRKGATRVVDLAQASSLKFVLMMGCGFDADVVHHLDATRTGPISHWSYAGPIFRSVRNYRYPEMQVHFAARTSAGEVLPQTLRAHWVFAFNFPVYANGIPFARQADPTDGEFDVCCFRGGSFPRGLFHLATIWTRTHGRWSGCVRFKTDRLRVEAVEPVPVQFDGDPGGSLPVEISVIPQGLTLIVP